MALTRKPVKGDRLRWPGWALGRVATVVTTPADDDYLCWIACDDRPVEPFLWRFRDGFNVLAEIVTRTEVAQ